MKMQLTVLGERFAVTSAAAANVCSRKNPGNDRPRADRPPMRRKLRRESPVQSRDDPVTRSSMALYLRAKVGRGLVGRRPASRLPLHSSLTFFPGKSIEKLVWRALRIAAKHHSTNSTATGEGM